MVRRLTDALRFEGDRHGTAAVIFLTWATVVVPALVRSYTAPKARQLTSDAGASSFLASVTTLLLVMSLAFTIGLLIVRHLGQLPTDRRGVLIVLILPWAYQVSRDAFAGTSLRLGGLLYPLILVVIWMLRPSLRQLSILGYLVGGTGVISVLMGALDPTKGILSTMAGGIVTPDKQILPWGILIGPLTDGNPLGQFLAIGTPAMIYIKRYWIRWPLVAVTAFGVMWTSNRGSLATLGVGLLVAVILKLTPYGARRPVVVTLLSAIAGLVAYLPLTARSNDAFTNRGYIWQASLRHWETNPLIGLGSQWYAQSAKYANNIGPTAFHGHNEFVQILVLGGLINLVLMLIMLLVVFRMAARWAELHDVKVPAAFVSMMLFSGMLEVSLSIVHRSFLLPVTVIPIAYMCFAREDRPMAIDAGRATELPEFSRPVPAAAPATVPMLLGLGGRVPTPAEPMAPVIIDPDEPPATSRISLATTTLRRLTDNLAGRPSVSRRTDAGDVPVIARARPQPETTSPETQSHAVLPEAISSETQAHAVLDEGEGEHDASDATPSEPPEEPQNHGPEPPTDASPAVYKVKDPAENDETGKD
jgi:O-antigen ligase